VTDVDGPSSDAIIETLRRRVEERRQAGLYPPDLEDQLDVHFRHIALRGVRDRLKRLEDAFAESDRAAASLDAAHVPTDSARPGGSLVHRVAARLSTRVLAQVREYARAVSEADRAVLLAYSDLVHRVDELQDRIDLGRGDDGDAGDARSADLARRVVALEEAEVRRRPLPWEDDPSPPAPEHGDAERYRAVVDRLAGHEPVLLGGNPWMAGMLDERGVRWEHTDDPVATLGQRGPGDVAAALLVHVFERLEPRDHLALVARLRVALASGAPVVAELRSPYAVGVAAAAPAHPAYVAFLLREAGFEAVEVLWDSSVPDGGSDAAALERHLATVLFGPAACAVVARCP
jgi:hypothetical protein